MSTGMFSLLLWIPFLLTSSLTGFFYCRSGYRQGLWRALVALGATLIAVVLSILLSGLFSRLLAPQLIQAIRSSGTDISAQMVDVVVGGLVGSVLSMVFFWLLMLPFNIVLRIISCKIKKDCLQPTKRSMHWYGLGVGALSALLFTFLWLSPLYGSLASYTPVLAQVAQMEEKQGKPNDLAPYLESITNHPVVAVSGSGPVAVVYDSVSSFSVNGASASLPELAQSFQRVMIQAQAVAEADETTLAAEAEKMVAVLRQDVVDQPWFYDLSQAMIQQLQQDMPKDNSVEYRLVLMFADALTTSETSFRQNCHQILDFLQLVLENGGQTIIDNPDPNALEAAGLLDDAGALANCTPEAVQVKNVLLASALLPAFDGDLNSVMEFLASYRADQPVTDPELQTREAEALLLCMGFRPTSSAEIILQHPLLGKAALQSINTDLTVLFDCEGTGSSFQTLAQTSQFRERLFAQLPEFGNGLEEKPYSFCVRNAQALCQLLEEGYAPAFYYNLTPDQLQPALQLLGEEFFQNHTAPVAMPMYRFLLSYSTQEVTMEGGIPMILESFCHLLSIRTETSASPFYYDAHSTAMYLVSCAGSPSLMDTANQLLAQNSSDPLGLGPITAEARTLLEEAFTYARQSVSPDMEYTYFYDGAFYVVDQADTDAYSESWDQILDQLAKLLGL